jgi:hypothetical protein
MLVLGRSGTGKTTVMVYRMWYEYLHHWNMVREKTVETKVIHEAVDEEDDEDEGEQQQNTARQPRTKAIEVTVHKHQLFLTRSGGLRSEVCKQFWRIRDTRRCADDERDGNEGPLFPDYRSILQIQQDEDGKEDDEAYITQSYCEMSESLRLRDPHNPKQHPGIPEGKWPMFLAGLEWFDLLDGTLPGNPFPHFRRAQKLEDNVNVNVNVNDNKGESEGDDSDDDLYEPNIFGDEEELDTSTKNVVREHSTQITFDLFQQYFWPKMVARTDLSEGLKDIVVWTEIVSHLKGSLEALHSKDGTLSLEKYQAFGAKRSRLDKGDERERVYSLFENIYMPMFKQKHSVLGSMFDMGDLTHHLWKRIQAADLKDMTSIHQVYIDEVQDYTQAELGILFHFAEPNGMFLAGDTAQSVNKGVCFRFSEIQQLFFEKKKQVETIKMPMKQTLSNNYRCQVTDCCDD